MDRRLRQIGFFHYSDRVLVSIGYYATNPPLGTYKRLGGYLSNRTFDVPDWVIALLPDTLKVALFQGIERPLGYDLEALFAEFQINAKQASSQPIYGKSAFVIDYEPYNRTVNPGTDQGVA